MPGMSELWGAETRKAIDNFPVSGRPLPRAQVHIVATGTSDAGSTFTDLDGSFRLQPVSTEGCRVEASMSGFRTASADCRTDADHFAGKLPAEQNAPAGVGAAGPA